jgi:hypothetical protein
MNSNELKYELIEKLEKIALKLDRAYKANLIRRPISPKVSKILETADSLVSRVPQTFSSPPTIAYEVEALSYEAQHPYSETSTVRNLLEKIVNEKNGLDFYTDTARDLAKRKLIQTPTQRRRGAFSEQAVLWIVGIVVLIAFAIGFSQSK